MSTSISILYSCINSCSPIIGISLGFLLLSSSDFGNPAHVPMKLFSIFINITNTPTTYTIHFVSFSSFIDTLLLPRTHPVSCHQSFYASASSISNTHLHQHIHTSNTTLFISFFLSPHSHATYIHTQISCAIDVALIGWHRHWWWLRRLWAYAS